MKLRRQIMRLGNHPTKLLHIGLMTISLHVSSVHAEMLKTDIPQQQYNIPAGDLAKALSLYAGYSGILLSFDSVITKNKTTAGLKGQYGLIEGFEILLKDSGLEVFQDNQGRFNLRHALKTKSTAQEDKTLMLGNVEVRAKRFYEIGPLPGLGLTKEQIPGNVQSISAKEIKEAHSLSLTDLMNRKLQSVNVNDYQGNPFQMDVTYRGFTAGPQIGTPQGLSVFIDGIRVNEPFGDVVNWDMIPMNALASVDVFPGSNPIFGLNTLGGAFALKTKDGFNHAGADAQVLAGSFGRKQMQLEGGWNNGTVAFFGAGNFFMEDGWRKNSPTDVDQFFGKASYRGDKLDLNLSTLLVGTDLVGNGLLPKEMNDINRKASFTSEDTTENSLRQFQLSGSYFVNDSFTITGQVYRRKSDRRQVGADVYQDYGNRAATRNMDAGDQYTCLYDSNNKYALPDYYVVKQPSNIQDIYNDVVEVFVNGADPANHPLVNEYYSNPEVQFVINSYAGMPADPSVLPAGSFNQDLPDYYAAYAQYNFDYFKNYRASNVYIPHAADGDPYSPPTKPDTINGMAAYAAFNFRYVAQPGLTEPIDFYSAINNSYYHTENPDGSYNQHLVIFKTAQNSTECRAGQDKYIRSDWGGLYDMDPVTGRPRRYDGASDGSSGIVKGVPTAVFTDTSINQLVNGASVQFNWNLDHHKLMIGAAIDSAGAKYGSGQRLGFFDVNRNGYLAPDLALDAFAAADVEIRNNDFNGNSITKSLYISETWSPVETLHFTGALRYNATRVRNTLSARQYGSVSLGLHDFVSEPDDFNICRPGDPCTTGYKIPDVSKLMNKPETEKFSYYSLNPSLGASWQANENLNIFGNVAQGTRTPSVIELGCAIDKTPTYVGRLTDVDGDGKPDPNYAYKSIAENRSCSMPTTLSGDPYLPQIKATTWDFGVRGRLSENLNWNLGVYRTDLRDDIYMVTLPGNRSFFDTIGKTRRQGIEAGISGRIGKATLHLNYALTDATFQDSFDLASDHNSSATPNLYWGVTELGERPPHSINVKPGNRMPGVPLHNLNASVSYEVTDKWTVGLSTVLHSESYTRGNENNAHQRGVTKYINYETVDPVTNDITKHVEARPSSNNPGKLPGYATFNFHTSYKLSKEWSASMIVNNLFDKEYYTAGRQGVNPFSPSIHGAIGPDGYNHNSFDWLNTTFLAPSAPRGVWFSLNWHFVPD